MAFTKADWVSTGATLLAAGIGFFVGGTAAAVLCITVGILIIIGVHFLERKTTEDKVLYALACLVFSPVLYFSVTSHSFLYHPKQPVTPDSIANDVKAWLADAGYSCSDGNSSTFYFSVNCFVDGHTVGVGRPTGNGTVLEVWSLTDFSEDQLLSLRKLQKTRPTDLVKLIQDVRIKTNGCGFDYWPDQILQEQWTELKYIHIDDDTHTALLESVQHLPLASKVVEQTVNKDLGLNGDLASTFH